LDKIQEITTDNTRLRPGKPVCLSVDFLLSRQMDCESTSLARSAVDRYMAAVGLYDVFDYGKAKACAALLTASGLVNSVKPFEKTGQMLS